MNGDPGTGRDHPSEDDKLAAQLQDPAVRAWLGEHLPELRRSAYGHRILYQALTVGFILGLAAYITGYAIKSSSPGEPLALIGDFLYALGWAMWTGVVVVLFVQVFPEVKRRQIKRSLDVYEATMRDEGRAPSGEDSERRPTNRDG